MINEIKDWSSFTSFNKILTLLCLLIVLSSPLVTHSLSQFSSLVSNGCFWDGSFPPLAPIHYVWDVVFWPSFLLYYCSL